MGSYTKVALRLTSEARHTPSQSTEYGALQRDRYCCGSALNYLGTAQHIHRMLITDCLQLDRSASGRWAPFLLEFPVLCHRLLILAGLDDLHNIVYLQPSSVPAT